jgi:hypothetical protein
MSEDNSLNAHNKHMGEDSRRNSLTGISRDAISFRLNSLEDGQDKIFSNQEKIFDKLNELTLALAKLPSSCLHADQCAGLVQEVKEIQEDRYKVKGSLWMIGVVCTFLGFVISQAGSLWRK